MSEEHTGLPPYNPDCCGYCFGCIEPCPIRDKPIEENKK